MAVLECAPGAKVYTRLIAYDQSGDCPLVRECPERKNEALWVALTGAAVFLVTFARDPSAWKTIWAEDGTVFLADAVDQGISSFFHFYAGYLNTVPRIGALIAAALPLSIAPLVIATYAVVVASLCGATVEALSGAYLQERWIRVGLGLCFGFLPAIREESIANMANLQFLLVAASFWVMLAIPRTRQGRGLSRGSSRPRLLRQSSGSCCSLWLY